MHLLSQSMYLLLLFRPSGHHQTVSSDPPLGTSTSCHCLSGGTRALALSTYDPMGSCVPCPGLTPDHCKKQDSPEPAPMPTVNHAFVRAWRAQGPSARKFLKPDDGEKNIFQSQSLSMHPGGICVLGDTQGGTRAPGKKWSASTKRENRAKVCHWSTRDLR